MKDGPGSSTDSNTGATSFFVPVCLCTYISLVSLSFSVYCFVVVFSSVGSGTGTCSSSIDENIA